MPIIDIEVVLKDNEILGKNLASDLADKLGEFFNSPSGTTWVKTHGLQADRYAENGTAQKDIHPVFVKVIKSNLNEGPDLQIEAEKISLAVAGICGRPPANVHIIYEPKGSGRIAFGGRLIP